MKIFSLLFLIFIAAASYAQEAKYPWDLTVYGGGALLCDELGCFGTSGIAFGASFGRQFTPHWSFELEGTYVSTNEVLPLRFDLATGRFFTPELQRTRVWGGATFLRPIFHLRESSSFFIALGGVGAFERQREKSPEGIFHRAPRNLGVKGGVSGGGGINFWFSPHWGIRPEARFYLVAKPLSGLRYTVGLLHRF